MKSPPDRLDKIRALLDSPNEGERAAARAALDRAGAASESKPAKGSPEWQEAKREWNRKIEFCVSRLGSSLLSRDEARIIRNVQKYRGDPWRRSAERFLTIYRKLASQDYSRKRLNDKASNSM